MEPRNRFRQAGNLFLGSLKSSGSGLHLAIWAYLPFVINDDICNFCALIKHGELLVANLGDSRAVARAIKRRHLLFQRRVH